MIKIISVNIEMDMHHDTVTSFLQSENADVVCLQEVFEKDLSMYEQALGMKSSFSPMAYGASYKFGGEKNLVYGIAILTKHNASFQSALIVGDETKIPVLVQPIDRMTERDSSRRMLLWADVQSTDLYRIATTHFTWTPDGVSTEYQKEDTKKLISILDDQLKDFVVLGDLNAPRGNESFSMLKDKYKDNIPLEYDSSLDSKLHRAPHLKFMVDGLFSTPAYVVTKVRLAEGVSDHKAIVAMVSKNGN